MINPIADFSAMRREIVARSRILDAWGFFLNVPTVIGSFFYLDRPVGAAVCAAILVSLLIATQMHKRMPMSRLMALCHIVFLPAIALLVMEVGPGSINNAFGIWATYSLVLMTICVLIDLFDLYRYFIQGNRTYVQPNQ